MTSLTLAPVKNCQYKQLDIDSHIMTLLVESIVKCMILLVRTLALKIDPILQTTVNNPTLHYLLISLLILYLKALLSPFRLIP